MIGLTIKMEFAKQSIEYFKISIGHITIMLRYCYVIF